MIQYFWSLVVSGEEKHKGWFRETRERSTVCFLKIFEQSGAFGIADLGSCDSILLSSELSAVRRLSIEVREQKPMMIGLARKAESREFDRQSVKSKI